MKKTYINPEIMIVRLKTMRMIAQSINPQQKDAMTSAMGRQRGGFWDEDDY